MGSIASINFKPTKNPVQVFHNNRTTPPNYLLSQMPYTEWKLREFYFLCNRSGDEALVLKQRIIDKAIDTYMKKFGQKFQARSYLWSAVVNIKPDTTMQDLERLVKHFKNKYGFQCYQIAIHRDEGHIDEYGNTIINHHAHLEFVTLDEATGKNRFRGSLQRPRALGLMQTEVAQILGMERGAYKNDTIDENGNFIKGTGRKRIEPRAYAQAVEKNKRLDAVREEIKGYEALSMSVDRVLQEATGKTKDLWVILDSKFKGERLEEIIGDALAQKKTDENTALKQDYQTLETAVIDLASVVEQMEGEQTEKKKSFTSPSQKNTPRKLTTKELATFCSKARKYMIGVNAELGDLKLYTKKIYMAVGELKKHRLTIAEVKTKLAEIDEQAKADYEALQEQYEGYLSPDDVEAKRSNELNRLCHFAGVGHEYGAEPFKADEALKTLEADIKQRNADLTALCEKAGGGKWNTPKYAKEHLEKGIDKLKEQADKAETAQTAKANLETAINATYSALIDPKEQKSDLAAQDKLKAIEDKGQEQETTINNLNEAIKSKDKALEDMEALKTFEAKQTQTYNALKRSRDRYKAMRVTNKGLVTQHADELATLQEQHAKELAEAQKPKEPNNTLQTQDVLKQEDIAPNPLQEPYDLLKGQHEALKQKLESLEINLPMIQSIGEDLAYHLQEIAKLAKTKPEEVKEAMQEILDFVCDCLQFTKRVENSMQVAQQKDSSGKHI
ncbi:hypothetical protein NHP21005_09190 [Helicobacter sp. NHP21005]|uniref:hypothetical protein n=1 Tax=Helicobacter felistomachi TaxID=3040201 RepID=UPI0025733D36|nr:hypothetical protein [Helicobacter sp. NHP21005]BEG57231.1 hypothetical protein NHP21005_09190 [Helicobacter sp. NHP21005]